MPKDWLDGADKRVERLKKIRKKCKGTRGISKHSLVKYCLLDLGMRRVKVQEYLEILIEFNAIYEEAGRFYNSPRKNVKRIDKRQKGKEGES